MAKSKKQIVVNSLRKSEKLAFNAAAKANKIHGVILVKLDKANRALEDEQQKLAAKSAKAAAKKIAGKK